MNRVANIFELLSDENDDGGARRPTAVANVETGAKKPEQKQQKPAANAQTQKPKSDRTAETKGRENRPPKSNERKEERRPRQERGEGAPQQQGQVSDRKPRDANRPPRQQRENAERRNKNVERAAEGNVEGGERKRVFDRKSGIGRGIRDNTKRAGGGRGNWGTVEDDKKAQLEQTETPEVVKEETTESTTEAKVEGGEKTEAVEPEVSTEDEEDAKLKTLAEYMQSRKAPTIALPPPRQVESKPEWDKYVPLTRASEDQPKQQKKEDKEVEADADAQKKTVSADQFFNFSDSSPRGGFRGGRGGRGDRGRGDRGRGDRGRGDRGRGDRGSKKPKAPTPNFKDEKSFPSLGNKA